MIYISMQDVVGLKKLLVFPVC